MWQRRNCAMQITMGGWIMNIAWLIFAVWAWLAFEDPLQVQKKRCAHPLHRQTCSMQLSNLWEMSVKTLSCVHGRWQRVQSTTARSHHAAQAVCILAESLKTKLMVLHKAALMMQAGMS